MSSEIAMYKSRYAQSMSTLEQMSNTIHFKRQICAQNTIASTSSNIEDDSYSPKFEKLCDFKKESDCVHLTKVVGTVNDKNLNHSFANSCSNSDTSLPFINSLMNVSTFSNLLLLS